MNSNTRSSGADGLGALEHDGDLQLPLDRGRGARRPRRRAAPPAPERRRSAPSAKRRTRSSRPERFDGDPGRARRDQELREPARAARSTSSSSAWPPASTGVADAVEHEAVAVARGRHRDAGTVPCAAGTGDAPRADQPHRPRSRAARRRAARPSRRPRPPPPRCWWARAAPAPRAAPSPRRRSPGRADPRRSGCPRRRTRARAATSSRARRPRTHQARSKPAGSSARARTVVSGVSCSRNLRVVSWKNCWSSLSARYIGSNVGAPEIRCAGYRPSTRGRARRGRPPAPSAIRAPARR